MCFPTRAWEPNPSLIATNSDYDEVLFCFLMFSQKANSTDLRAKRRLRKALLFIWGIDANKIVLSSLSITSLSAHTDLEAGNLSLNLVRWLGSAETGIPQQRAPCSLGGAGT